MNELVGHCAQQTGGRRDGNKKLWFLRFQFFYKVSESKEKKVCLDIEEKLMVWERRNVHLTQAACDVQ